MKLAPELKAHFFTASIMRGHVPVLRQGTLNAIDGKDALDRVFQMGRAVWKRTVLEVTILEPGTGAILATSTIDKEVGKHLLPYSKPDKDDKEDEDNGFVPWDKPISTFMPATVGTYFMPKKFAKIISFK